MNTAAKLALLGVVLTSLTAGTIVASDKAAAANADRAGPVVEMAPYVVKDSRVLPEPETWSYVKVPAMVLTRGERSIVVPGYEMLSNLSTDQTRVLVRDLQLRQFAAAYLWPMLTQALPRAPICVVVDANLQYAAPRRSVTSLGHWEGDPVDAGDVQPSPSRYTSTVNASYSATVRNFAAEYGLTEAAAMNADPVEVSLEDEEEEAAEEKKKEEGGSVKRVVKPLPDGFVELAINGGPVGVLVRAGEPKAGVERPTEEEIAATISYDLNLFAMDSLAQKPPRWFARGLSNLLGCTQVSQTRFQFALVRENLSQQTMPSLTAVLRKDGQFVEQEALLASIFVHFGLYGDNGSHAARFMQFVERQSRGEEPTEALFKEIFGVSIKTMERDLATYGRSFAAFKSTDIKGLLPPMPAHELRAATQAEVARLKGEVSIAQATPAAALDELRIAYWRGEREPSMLALLAKLEQQIGSTERARKLVEPLLALPAPPAEAFITAARLRLADALSGKPARQKLALDQTNELVGLLGRALAAGVATEDLCDTLADVIIRSSALPDGNMRGFLAAAAKRYPRNKKISDALEYLAATQGDRR